ncbi:MAG: methyltransferase [Deltaproteobacteria bacterium]|nr:methyltransferase [Deltaproteobacteria bacterium]
MSALTPKERIQKLFRKEAIDTMPIFSGMGMVTIQAIQEMGIRFASVHTSAANLAGSARTTAKMFGFDAAIVPYDMCTIPEALGRGISLYADSAEDILYPTVPSKWATLDEVDVNDDFLNSGRMPLVDDAFQILKSETNENLGLGAWVLGPFTMAGQVIELDILLKGVKKDKERVEAFLGEMTELVIKAAVHYESLGVDYITIREMGSGTDLLSPRMWKTLIGPNLTKVFDAIRIPTVNHICGSTDMIIEMMNECGAEALSVDQKNNVVETRKKVGDDVLIFGNFDPYGTLVQMDSSEVEAVIKKCIDDGVDAVWPGCDLWPDVKKENVEAYVNAIGKYGREATPAVGRL